MTSGNLRFKTLRPLTKASKCFIGYGTTATSKKQAINTLTLTRSLRRDGNIMSASETVKKKEFKRALLSWETKHSILVVREDGELFQVFKIPKLRRKISPWTCWCNERLCDKTLSRLHLTCFSCRIRRVAGREIPQALEVTAYILLIPRNRGRLKSFLGKKFCTLAERFNR